MISVSPPAILII
uniref:Uncharacterized protein n=1 Tax=Rhizophora mucronata TaxID=61149 RepID=A0A2P2PQM8_RHIMU